MENNKVVFLPITPVAKTKNVETKKERKKRVITSSKRWIFGPEELTYEYQIAILTAKDATSRSYTFILSQIQAKIYGYKTQDSEKRHCNCEGGVVGIDDVLDKMRACNLDCYYCRGKVALLYEYVRDPKQWTLERIDNSIGHTAENVVIACLSCNLRRRTMYHERFLFTKNMVISKADT
jgi:hypothetical protein